MGSFKFKLVSYFALVALLPVVGAFYGFDTIAKRHETQRIDNRLQADVRAAVAGYVQQVDAAERRARSAGWRRRPTRSRGAVSASVCASTGTTSSRRSQRRSTGWPPSSSSGSTSSKTSVGGRAR